MKGLLHAFETFDVLVSDIYTECVDNGYTKEGAIGKVKYELMPMTNNNNEKAILYFELSHFLSKKDCKDAFLHAYQELKTLLAKNIELETFIRHSELLCYKKQEICHYAKKAMQTKRS